MNQPQPYQPGHNGHHSEAAGSLSRAAAAPSTVSSSSLRAAWRYVELRRQDAGASTVAVAVAGAVRDHGPVLLSRATAALIGVLGAHLEVPAPELTDGRDAIAGRCRHVLPVLIDKLTGPGARSSLDALPVALGVLSATLVERDPTHWLDQQPRPGALELDLLTVTLWHLARLVDTNHPGRADGLIEPLLDRS